MVSTQNSQSLHVNHKKGEVFRNTLEEVQFQNFSTHGERIIVHVR